MGKYQISLARSASKELHALDRQIVHRILPKIEALATEPRPGGCRKLQGEENLWRIRIGDYRIIYSIDDRLRVVDIKSIRHRRDAYR
ncbi:MAG TPA: type II toxin-antitoxin system RelE/ParE family toxin [Thermoanaerobaculia bacterium]|jgi:mRNA interferase RelE/StbE|nr:type II toxin-antitoxin system RelE/ParE family toxin [Thermoanaerobaculia bacterium]